MSRNRLRAFREHQASSAVCSNDRGFGNRINETVFQLHFLFKESILAMSRREKLKIRFLNKPTDFTFDELGKLMRYFGYMEVPVGKTAGSRVAFYNEISDHIIRLHRPHPGHVLKSYQLVEIAQELKRKGYL